MPIDFTPHELETILESLTYSKQRVSDAQGTPSAVRKTNLPRINAALEKVRARVQVQETSAKHR